MFCFFGYQQIIQHIKSLTPAHIRAINRFAGFPIKEWHTLFTMLTLSIVLTIIAYATTHTSGMLIDGAIKVTRVRVIITITCCAKWILIK